jgi:hypothetical protein
MVGLPLEENVAVTPVNVAPVSKFFKVPEPETPRILVVFVIEFEPAQSLYAIQAYDAACTGWAGIAPTSEKRKTRIIRACLILVK